MRELKVGTKFVWDGYTAQIVDIVGDICIVQSPMFYDNGEKELLKEFIEGLYINNEISFID